MKTKTALLQSLWGIVIAASCSTNADVARTVEVFEPNTLGIRTLQTDRWTDDGNEVYRLRALTADDAEVARVQLTVGDIADVPAVPGEASLGSEIVVSVHGNARRVISRETVSFALIPSTLHDSNATELLEIPAVATTLASEAAIIVASRPDTVATETAYYPEARTCPSSLLNTTPLARQCCYQTYTTTGGLGTIPFALFVNPVENIVFRYRGTACKGTSLFNRTAACSGTGCYFGPNGMGRPSLTPPPTGYPYGNVASVWQSDVGGYECGSQHTATPFGSNHGDVTGTYPTGRGCCIDGTGPCGTGIKACTTCGGGGSAGQGAWDDF